MKSIKTKNKSKEKMNEKIQSLIKLNSEKILKKSQIIAITILLGLIINHILLVLKVIKVPLLLNQMFSKKYLYTDFTYILKYSAGKTATNETANYFPFAYLLMHFIEILSFEKYNAAYFVTFTLCCIINLYTYISLFYQKDNFKNFIPTILILLFIHYPFWFLFKRGNIEIIIFTFLSLFYKFYRKEKYRLSSLILAIPICMKLYPAVFILLFLNKKKYKEFSLCVITSILLTLISFMINLNYTGGINQILNGFVSFNDTLGSLGGMQCNHTILFGIYYFLYKVFNVNLMYILTSNIVKSYTIVIIIVSLILSFYIIFAKQEEWKKITILSLMMIFFPHVSFDYTLINLIVPVIAFILDENTTKLNDIFYSIAFGIMFVPIGICREIIEYVTPDLGLFLKPLLAVIMINAIILSNNKIESKGKIPN